MAKLSRDDVLKLARLARIELTEEELVKYQTELVEILSYVEQLQSADVEDVEPTYQVTGLKNVTRSDEIVDYGIGQEELLKNLPDHEDSSIKVKRVL